MWRNPILALAAVVSFALIIALVIVVWANSNPGKTAILAPSLTRAVADEEVTHQPTHANGPKRFSLAEAVQPAPTNSMPVDPSQHSAQPSIDVPAQRLYADAVPAVVSIIVFNQSGEPVKRGSGFVVTPDGWIATNHHVIDGAWYAKVVLDTHASFDVEGVGAFDATKDLALIKVDGQGLPVLQLAVEPWLNVGTRVYALGNPMGLTHTLSEGIVSALRDINGVSIIQTTTPISAGSSGGPLLLEDGRVVGITSFQFAFGQNLNFAVSAADLSRLIGNDNPASIRLVDPLGGNVVGDLGVEPDQPLFTNRANWALGGVNKMMVLVEEFKDELKRDGQRYGLTEDAVKRDVKLALRTAGIEVIDDPSEGYLYININSLSMEEMQLHAVGLSIEFRTEVTTTRDGEISAIATVWDTSAVGAYSRQYLNRVREAVRDEVDAFVDDWLAANPKR